MTFEEWARSRHLDVSHREESAWSGHFEYHPHIQSMWEGWQAGRVAALEEAAKVCETTVWSADIDRWRVMTKKDVSVKSMLACADAIRALKETP